MVVILWLKLKEVFFWRFNSSITFTDSVVGVLQQLNLRAVVQLERLLARMYGYPVPALGVMLGTQADGLVVGISSKPRAIRQ